MGEEDPFCVHMSASFGGQGGSLLNHLHDVLQLSAFFSRSLCSPLVPGPCFLFCSILGFVVAVVMFFCPLIYSV